MAQGKEQRTEQSRISGRFIVSADKGVRSWLQTEAGMKAAVHSQIEDQRQRDLQLEKAAEKKVRLIEDAIHMYNESDSSHLIDLHETCQGILEGIDIVLMNEAGFDLNLAERDEFPAEIEIFDCGESLLHYPELCGQLTKRSFIIHISADTTDIPKKACGVFKNEFIQEISDLHGKDCCVANVSENVHADPRMLAFFEVTFIVTYF